MKILIVFLALCCAAFAQNQYYVSTTGSDSNNGTSSGTPWATINHADAALSLGTSDGTYAAIVHVSQGTYTFSKVSCSAWTAYVCTTHSGTDATHRIKYVSDTSWGAKIRTLSGTSNNVLGCWLTTGNWTDVVGFDIGGTGTVDSGNCVQGLFFGNGSNNRAIKNHIHDAIGANPALGQCPGGGAGLNLGSGTHDYAIGNVVHDNGLGVGTGCPNAGGTNGHGIYCAYQFDVVQNNIVYHNGAVGLHCYHNPDHIIVTNNLVFNNGTGILVGSDGSGSPTSITVNNNISRQSPTKACYYFTGISSTSNSVRNNISYNCAGGDFLLGNTGGGAFTGNITGLDPKEVNFNLNPASPTMSGGMEVWSNADYHLASNSPAIKAGTTLCASGVSGCIPTTDIDGSAIGSLPDIGVYVFGGTVTTPKPAPPTGLTAIVH